ncbi:MAG: hypothetical protein J5601_01765, partial [Elusimicrobiaceae bacterium]|nr:hypothetical protein [Elusimicrobiaceae bacterium]
MKKFILLLLLLVPLCGCEEFFTEAEPDLSRAQTFLFPSIEPGTPDWRVRIIRRVAFDNTASYLAAPDDENAKPTVVAVYETDCEKCKEQAPYLNLLAQQFDPKDMDFVVIFLDFDREKVANLPWLNELDNVKVVYNQPGYTAKGICLDAFECIGNTPSMYLLGKGRRIESINTWSSDMPEN